MGRWIESPSGWAYDPTGVEHGQEPAMSSLPPTPDPLPPAVTYGRHIDWPGPVPDPSAATAGEQDHTDPWVFMGDSADRPVNP